MPNRSVVGGCSNTPNLNEGIALHFILFADDDRPQARKRRTKWVGFVKFKRPTELAICSNHFAAEDFVRMYSFTPGQDEPVIPRDYSISENSAGSWSSCSRWSATVTAKAIQQRQTTPGKINHSRQNQIHSVL